MIFGHEIVLIKNKRYYKIFRIKINIVFLKGIMLNLVFVLNIILIVFSCEGSTNFSTDHIDELPPLIQTICGKKIDMFINSNIGIKELNINDKNIVIANNKKIDYKEVFKINENQEDKLSNKITVYCYVGMGGKFEVNDFIIPCDFYFTLDEPYRLISEKITIPINDNFSSILQQFYEKTISIPLYEKNTNIKILSIFTKPIDKLCKDFFCIEEKSNFSCCSGKQKTHLLCEVITARSVYEIIYLDKDAQFKLDFNSKVCDEKGIITYRNQKKNPNLISYITLIDNSLLPIDEYFKNPDGYQIKLSNSNECSNKGGFNNFFKK